MVNLLSALKSGKNKDKQIKRLSKYSTQYEKGVNSEENVMNKLEEEFIIGPVKLRQIVQHFLEEFKKGLEQEGYSLAMHPSFVTQLPNGRENGNFLSLDLGGTNFKVCEVFLEKQQQVRVRQKKISIPETAKCADGERLFDFMADSVGSF